MLRLSALAVFAALVSSTVPASAQQVQAGALECRGGESISFIVGSVSEFNCIFRPNVGPAQQYRARLTRAGVDVGVTAVSGLGWAVFAPTNVIGLGDLSGNYGGATAGGAFVIGGGANVMYGGSNNSFALQPLSLEGQVGINVYAGVAGLELRFEQ